MDTKRKSSHVRLAYQFIEANKRRYSVQTMCRVLEVAPSGYYAWLKKPISERDQEDARLLRLIRASFDRSHGIYGAPRVFLDLREAGETCSKHRVERLMRENGLRTHGGFRIRRVVAGRGMLSAVVIRKDRRKPPKSGFIRLAAKLERDVPNARACWDAEIERVCTYWSAHSTKILISANVTMSHRKGWVG